MPPVPRTVQPDRQARQTASPPDLRHGVRPGQLAGFDVQTVRLVSRLLAPGGAANVTDFTVVNDRSVGEVAREVVARAGWLAAPGREWT
jgi:hypothetical protein